MHDSYDVAIIGAGPGGYVCAIRAAQLGLKTLIIEKENLGGVCLNWGCIPTKSLLSSARVYDEIKHAGEYGIVVDNVASDVKKIVERSRKIAKKLSMGVAYLMKKNAIEHIKGTARFIDKNTLQIKTQTIEQQISAKNIVVATGANAKDLPSIQADHETIWNYRDALQVKKFPKSLLIAGSGAIGIEFASFFNSFGVDVTVVEAAAHILPTEDIEISQMAQKEYEKAGITFLTSTLLSDCQLQADQVTVTLDNKGNTQTRSAEKLLLAIGIKPQIDDLNLETIQVKTHKGHIVTNKTCQTNIAHIYAIGDVTSPPWLAHKASHEGVIVAEAIAGDASKHGLETTHIPGCIYAHPQVASIGLNEQAAKEKGYDIMVGRFPFSAVGKALTIGKSQGMIKTIVDKKTQEILGVHMVGEDVTELINTISVAKHAEITGAELIGTVFAHPTLSEGLHESFLDAVSRVIHM